MVKHAIENLKEVEMPSKIKYFLTLATLYFEIGKV